MSGWIRAVADPIRLEMMLVLATSTSVTVSSLAIRTGAPPRTLRRHLEVLIVHGVVEVRPGAADGETPGRPASRFVLRPEVRTDVLHRFGAQVADGREAIGSSANRSVDAIGWCRQDDRGTSHRLRDPG